MLAKHNTSNSIVDLTYDEMLRLIAYRSDRLYGCGGD